MTPGPRPLLRRFEKPMRGVDKEEDGSRCQRAAVHGIEQNSLRISRADPGTAPA